MPTGAELMEQAARLLNDEEHIRWPLSEMALWLHDGVKATVLAKPSASTQSIVLTLGVGTLQRVPQTGTPKPLMLVALTRNLKTTAEDPRVGDRIITPVSRDILDAQSPGWHDKMRVPHQKLVRHFVYDEANPLEYYVFPGNNGSGIVEAVVSTLPGKLVPVNGQDTNSYAAWTGDIGLPEPYSVPMLDYLLYRCHAKDDTAGQAGRAQGHYQLFASAVGIKINVEGATSPNARK